MSSISTPAVETCSKRFAPFWVGSARAVALTFVLVAGAVYEAGHPSAVLNANVWLHLRSGLWMLQSHSVPQRGLFSQSGSLPWVDSSWASDVVLASAYKLFGLRALPLMLMLVKVGLAVLTFLLARVGKASFWSALCFSAVAQYVIPLSQSLPYDLSIVFFGAVLLLLKQSGRAGTVRSLYWLPALFAVWANVHALFLAGLALLALYFVSMWLEGLFAKPAQGWLESQTRRPALKPGLAVLGSCLLVTCLNPYGYHLFSAAYRSLYSEAAFQYFAEMRAISFRHAQDYSLMLLVMAAFLALGRRRSVRIFELLVLIAGTLVAFRIQRDSWMAVLPAIAVLSDGFGFTSRKIEADIKVRWERPFVAGLVCAILAIAAFRLPHSEELMSVVNQSFPARACDFIRDNHLPQPLFNEYSWGSFLTWYLPEYPVAIDSRIELYGDEITESYFKVIAGGVRLDSNSSLAQAQTLLLQKQSGMVTALTTLPPLTSQYRLAYSDDVATVFVRR
jgi:hypothetical protein